MKFPKSCYWIVLLACGSMMGCDDDSALAKYAGVYEVTLHTDNPTGCDTEGPTVDEYAHFHLELDEFFGVELLAFGQCTSASVEDCNTSGIFNAYLEDKGDIVREVGSSSGGGEVACSLSYSRSTLVTTDQGVRIESRQYRGTDDTLNEEQCDPDVAIERGTTMMCESFSVLEGALL